MRLNTKSGEWTDIMPDKRPDRTPGGYMGLGLDRQKPGTLAVATMNRWNPIDTVWRTTDGGKTWHDIAGNSTRDVSATPFLRWGKPEAKLGWWMAALAIDPFDSDRACYATGATVYATNEFSKVSKGEPTAWRPWVEGIEQTAVITLLSPSAGPHLISGFGDLGGFRHDDLDVSPPQGMFTNPMFGNTNTLDCAGLAPNVIVRSGRPHEGESRVGYSEDGGASWKPLTLPAAPSGRIADTPIAVSADGKTFIVLSPTPVMTCDRGETWVDVQGLPSGARPVAARVDSLRFYAINFDTREIHHRVDGGATFSSAGTHGLPDDHKPDRPTWHEAPSPLLASPGKAGDLWFGSRAGLFHSTDAGKTFERLDGGVQVSNLSFGKAPEGKSDPALFAIGTRDGTKAIWRSDDLGKAWLRVNDDAHQWGTRFRCIAGDPRIFGRVYLATDGRGILYGEPAARSAGAPATTRSSTRRRSEHVKVCQVGYLPGETKLAMLTTDPKG